MRLITNALVQYSVDVYTILGNCVLPRVSAFNQVKLNLGTWPRYHLLIGLHKNYIWNRTLSPFQNEVLSVKVSILVQEYLGEKFGFSPNDLKCVLQRLFNISIHDKHRFTNWSFWVYFSLSRKVDITIERWWSNLSIFVQSNFFGYCFLIPSLSVA